MPTLLVITSVTGNVSQNQFRPKRENTYPRGTKSITVRITVNAELFRLEPTAWKNTGKIREVTSGRKLIPTKRNSTRPISITCSSDVNTRSICVGIETKHIVPGAINANPNKTAIDSVFCIGLFALPHSCS